MKIKSIELENFRGFLGPHEADFSIDPKRPLTVFIAQNGTGKSNLMEAIHWCLFGKVPASADRPNEIRNDMSSPREVVSVILTIIDDKTDSLTGEPIEYTMSRRLQQDNKSDLMVYKKEQGRKNQTTVQRPKILIEGLLPERLSPYFLYSGEGIQQMFKNLEEEEVKSSIEDMQGLTYAKKARNDLENYATKLHANLNQNTNRNKKLDDAKTELSNLADNISSDQKILNEVNSSLKEEKQKLATVQEALKNSNNEAINAKKKDNTELEKSLKREENRLEDLKEAKFNLLDEKGFQVYSFHLKKTIEDFIKKEKKSGKMPAKYSEATLQNVLDDELCICGRPVEEHSENEDFVAAWKFIQNSFKNAGTEDQSKAEHSVEDFVKFFSSENRKARIEFNKLNQDIAESENIYKESYQKYKENEKFIDETPKDDDLEANLDLEKSLLSKIEKLESKRFDAQKRLILNQAEKTKQQKIVDQNKGDIDPTIKARKDFVDLCIEKLDSRIEELITKGRDDLGAKLALFNNKYNTKTDEYIEFINETSYIPEIRNEETKKGRVQNTANLNLLSLFYALSLIDICIERFDDEEDIIQPGTIAPLVCDAPFSSMGEVNLESMIKLLSTVPEQCIIFVNPKDYYAGAKNILLKDKKVGVSYFSQRNQKVEPLKNPTYKIGKNNYKSFIANKSRTTNSFINLEGAL